MRARFHVWRHAQNERWKTDLVLGVVVVLCSRLSFEGGMGGPDWEYGKALILGRQFNLDCSPHLVWLTLSGLNCARIMVLKKAG